MVEYNNLVYKRSRFPNTVDVGPPPNEAMGVDPLGEPIRTWTLNQYDFDFLNKRNRIIPRYFRLIQDYDTVAGFTNYQGMTKFAQSAYNYYFFDIKYSDGYTVEIDQSGSGFGDVPANKCGVALQQRQELNWDTYETPPTFGVEAYIIVRQNLIKVGGQWVEDPNAQPPFTYYAFLLFNHPLYFRRVFQLAYYYGDNASPSVNHEVTKNFTPTDKNYCRRDFLNNGSESYFQPDNAAWTFTLSAGDILGSVWVKSIESND